MPRLSPTWHKNVVAKSTHCILWFGELGQLGQGLPLSCDGIVAFGVGQVKAPDSLATPHHHYDLSVASRPVGKRDRGDKTGEADSKGDQSKDITFRPQRRDLLISHDRWRKEDKTHKNKLMSAQMICINRGQIFFFFFFFFTEKYGQQGIILSYIQTHLTDLLCMSTRKGLLLALWHIPRIWLHFLEGA